VFSLLFGGAFLTSGGGLAGVDVSDDNDVDMSLLFTIVVEDMSAMLIDIMLKTLSV
jgi:hypothetical protein